MGQSVLVIGDVMLDEYVIGMFIDFTQPYPHSDPTDIIYNNRRCGNVARNLAQLGSQVTLIGCQAKTRSYSTQ